MKLIILRYNKNKPSKPLALNLYQLSSNREGYLYNMDKNMKNKYVKADYAGKEFEHIAYNAVREGKLDAYFKHPESGEMIKVPKELAKRIVDGEKINMDYLLNFIRIN